MSSQYSQDTVISGLHPTPGTHPTDLSKLQSNAYYKTYVRFLKDYKLGKCADIGCKNVKMEFIKQHIAFSVDQIDRLDFNKRFRTKEKYDSIFAFEIIEHLANQQLFMECLKDMLTSEGRIFLSFPSRPCFLWTKNHYYEIRKDRFVKWILEPLDMKIVRTKRAWHGNPWYYYIRGMRPLIRIIFDYTTIYEIRHG